MSRFGRESRRLGALTRALSGPRGRTSGDPAREWDAFYEREAAVEQRPDARTGQFSIDLLRTGPKLSPAEHYERFVAERGRRGKLPDFGYAVARGNGYDAYFDKEGDARRAAHLLVDAIGTRVDVVEIRGHGQDRSVVDVVEPRAWRKRP